MVLGGEGGEGGEGVLRDETALAEPEGLAEAFHLRGVDKIPICVIGLDIIMHILMLTCQLPIEVGGRPSEGSKLFLESRTNINILRTKKNGVSFSNFDDMPNINVSPITTFPTIIDLKRMLVSRSKKSDGFENIIREVEKWPHKATLE